MKKVLSLVLITAVALSAKAQKTYLQGGLNLANITKTKDGQSENNNILATFNVGIMHRFGLSPVVDLETGLLFTGKGSKAETYFNGGNDYVKTKFNPYYVELPLSAVFKIPAGKGLGLFVSAGPYVAIGVAGKAKSEARVLSIVSTYEKTIKFNNDDPFTSEQEDASYNKLKRFDFGLNVGAGVTIQHLLLKVNYEAGFAKINSTDQNNGVDDKNKYQTISISVGFPLGR